MINDQHMRMWLKFALLGLALLMVISIQIEPSHSLEQTAAGIRLEEILNQTGEYCEKVKNLALHYVCKENVLNTIYYYKTDEVVWDVLSSSSLEATTKLDFKGTKEESWIYDYQLIRKSGNLIERRNLLEENGKTKIEQDVNLKNLKYSSKYIVFGPVGFLSKFWQNHFSYEIVRIEDFAERKAVVIKASPKRVRKDNYNVGHVWIDVEDYSILRIQWEPLDIQNLEGEKIRLPSGNYKRTVVWDVEFAVEAKGVRFPSLQTVQEILIEDNKKRYVLERTEFSYKDYKFFVVETEIKHSPPITVRKPKGLVVG